MEGFIKGIRKLQIYWKFKYDFECNYEFRLSMLHNAHILTVLLH